MDSNPPELGPALLRWLNSFDLPETLESWKALQDGKILWRILATVEPGYFAGDLPEEHASASDNWIPRWQNLKHINRVVMAFIRDECGKLQALGPKMNPDLKAIAIDGSPKETIELVKLALLAAMYSPLSNQQMVRVMEKLGPKVAIPIATCIGHMETLDHKLSEAQAQTDTESDIERASSPEADGAVRNNNFRRDPELEQEEKLIKAYSNIKQLEEKNRNLNTDLQQTRKRLQSLEEDLASARDRLERGGSLDNEDETVTDLRQKLEQDKGYILELESQLEHATESSASLERQLERLKEDADSKQKLRDEMQLLRVERDDLSQKAKAAENLKKKIQSLQESDKTNLSLRQDLETAQADVRSMGKFKDRYYALQKQHEETTKTLSNVEQEIFDSRNTRKRLDHEINILSQRWEAAKDQRTRDQETIQEQEAKIKDLEAGNGRPVSLDPENLDGEVAATDRLYQEVQARNAALEAEILQLREGREGSEEPSLDNQNLRMMRERYEQLEKKYLDTYQENLGLDASLKDVEVELLDSRPFIEVRERLKIETEKASRAEKRLAEVEVQLSDASVQLEAANSKLAAVGKDESDAADELKRSAAAENDILQSENNSVRQRAKVLEQERDEARSLLRHALLNSHALSQEDPRVRSSNELKLVKEQLKLVQAGQAQADDVAMRLAQRIEDGREGLAEAKAATSEQQAQQSSATQISTLEARLAQAEADLAAAQEAVANAPKQALRSDDDDEKAKAAAAAVQRELSLMTSAWYDLSARMQSDAVVVQRRGVTEAPRSFLNRQRRLVSVPSATAARR